MIAAAPSVMERLRKHKVFQAQRQLLVGELWNNPNNLVFTDNVGGYLTKPSIYRDFKAAVRAIVRPDACFHDLRHSCAVAALRSGDNIKTVQGNLGHVTDSMRRESAARMEKFFKSVSKRYPRRRAYHRTAIKKAGSLYRASGLVVSPQEGGEHNLRRREMSLKAVKGK